MGSLLATLVLLFAFQGEAILAQPLVIALLAVPIFLQGVIIAGIAYWLNRVSGEKHNIACPSSLIGASNFLSWQSQRPSGCSDSIPARRWQRWLAC
jgi:ACR3 family arsenite transporter